MSESGTFRTWRDVRLESVNRLKADMISAEKFQKWFELPKAGRCAFWIKVKNPKSPAMLRAEEGTW